MRIPEKSPNLDTILYSDPIMVTTETVELAKRYNDEYLHWNDLRYREFGRSNRMDVWRVMKLQRIMSYRHVRIMDLGISYSPLNDYIQRTIHKIDSGHIWIAQILYVIAIDGNCMIEIISFIIHVCQNTIR